MLRHPTTRARWASQKRAWRARVRNGQAVFRLEADAVDIRELLGECGICVANNADTEALGQCLSELVRRWHDGEIAILCPPADDLDGDGPA
jgi:hypothetical protein